MDRELLLSPSVSNLFEEEQQTTEILDLSSFPDIQFRQQLGRSAIHLPRRSQHSSSDNSNIVRPIPSSSFRERSHLRHQKDVAPSDASLRHARDPGARMTHSKCTPLTLRQCRWCQALCLLYIHKGFSSIFLLAFFSFLLGSEFNTSTLNYHPSWHVWHFHSFTWHSHLPSNAVRPSSLVYLNPSTAFVKTCT